MFYSEFCQIKELKARLAKNLEKKISKQNQPISIRDIFILPVNREESVGEAKYINPDYEKIPHLIRLIDHIDSIANIANTYHETYYCDLTSEDNHHVRKDCENKITRIVMNEFSLYTQYSLKNAEMDTLIPAIYAIAKNQHENVHLLLSSLPFSTKEKQILNVSIYVQCGPDPKIEVFCKARASDQDLTYTKNSNFSQQELSAQEVNISRFVGKQDGITISHNSVFIAETKGGAKYLQAIDICLDHWYEHAKTLFLQASDKMVLDTYLIPYYIDQMLSSNFINQKAESKLTDTIVHIDPINSDRQSKPMKANLIQATDFISVLKQKYSKMSIKKTKKGFVILNPMFGPDYEIIPQEERTLSSYSDELKNRVQKYNERVKRKIIDSQLSSLNYKVEEYNDIKGQSDIIVNETVLRYQDMIKKCQVTFMESVLKNEGFALKQEVSSILKNSFEAFLAMRQNESTLLKKSQLLFNDLVTQLTKINNGRQVGFLKDLIAQASETKNQLNAMGAYDLLKQDSALMQLD